MNNQKERTLARECLVKILYQHDMTEYSFIDIEDTFIEKRKYDRSYFRKTLDILEGNLLEIDKFIKDNTDLELNDLTQIDKAIIRLAVCEFLYHKEIPEKVTINESIAIAKKFSTTDSYKFINNILDQLYKFITSYDQK